MRWMFKHHNSLNYKPNPNPHHNLKLTLTPFNFTPKILTRLSLLNSLTLNFLHLSFWSHFGNTQTHIHTLTQSHARISPMNNWLLSCRWMCPSAGASCVAAGKLSTRSDASFTFRSARTLCHRLSFSGTCVSTRTSSGPFPTSKEKTTSEEAGAEGDGWRS